MRGIVLGTLTVLFAFGITRPVVAQDPEMLQDGAFGGISESINGLVRLRISQQRLAIDHSRWSRMRKAASGASTSTAADTKSPLDKAITSFIAASQSELVSRIEQNNAVITDFSGDFVSGRVIDSTAGVSIALHEMAPPRRTLEIADSPNGNLRIILSHPAGEVVLINQTYGGVTTVSVAMGNKRFISSERSFDDLAKRHADVFDKLVYPAMAACGIRRPASIQEKRFIDSVLAALTPPRQEDVAEADKLIARLDGPDFAAREASRDALTAGMTRFRSRVMAALDAPGTSAETRLSLEQAVAAAGQKDEVERLVGELGLLDDGPYLVSLLPLVSPQQRQVVVARLQQVTGEPFGDDLKEWETWVVRSMLR